MEETVVYTDGSCLGNPGPGGWAWLAVQAPCVWKSGYEEQSTNQRMELMAAFDAVRSFSGPMLIISDSQYVVNTFKLRWWAGWVQRDWKNAHGRAVSHRDLWEPLVGEYLLDEDRLRFRWVKGHSGNANNSFVDTAARTAATIGRGDFGFRGER